MINHGGAQNTPGTTKRALVFHSILVEFAEALGGRIVMTIDWLEGFGGGIGELPRRYSHYVAIFLVQLVDVEWVTAC
jgi:hypothetical protein